MLRFWIPKSTFSLNLKFVVFKFLYKEQCCSAVCLYSMCFYLSIGRQLCFWTMWWQSVEQSWCCWVKPPSRLRWSWWHVSYTASTLVCWKICKCMVFFYSVLFFYITCLSAVCAGVSLTVHTMYILECAPKRLRGMVGVSVASFVSMGKFFGQLLGIRYVINSRFIFL